MSATQDNPQPTQGELLGSFFKLAHEFAGLADQSRIIAEQYIRMARDPENITGKDADPLDLALQTLADTGRAIEMFKNSLDGMEKASRVTGTEQHKKLPQTLQQRGMKLLNMVHPSKAEKLQQGISSAIMSFNQQQGWFGLPIETIHQTMVEPVLDGLGYTPECREQATINYEHCHWLRSADRVVALLVTDHPETSYGPEDGDINRLDARQKKLRRETGFEGRFVFTNGMEWCMYYPDGPVEWFIPVPFTLEQPDGFWDLFMLSLTQDDLDSQHQS